MLLGKVPNDQLECIRYQDGVLVEIHVKKNRNEILLRNVDEVKVLLGEGCDHPLIELLACLLD